MTDTTNLLKELEKVDNVISHNKASMLDTHRETYEKREIILKRIDENTKHKQIIFDEIVRNTKLISEEKNDKVVTNLRQSIFDLTLMYDKL